MRFISERFTSRLIVKIREEIMNKESPMHFDGALNDSIM